MYLKLYIIFAKILFSPSYLPANKTKQNSLDKHCLHGCNI